MVSARDLIKEALRVLGLHVFDASNHQKKQTKLRQLYSTSTTTTTTSNTRRPATRTRHTLHTDYRDSVTTPSFSDTAPRGPFCLPCAVCPSSPFSRRRHGSAQTAKSTQTPDDTTTLRHYTDSRVAVLFLPQISLLNTAFRVRLWKPTVDYTCCWWG